MSASKKNAGDLQQPQGTGESQGGTQPGQDAAQHARDGGQFHGGQSVQAYHGPANPNATSKDN